MVSKFGVNKNDVNRVIRYYRVHTDLGKPGKPGKMVFFEKSRETQGDFFDYALNSGKLREFIYFKFDYD